MIESCSKQRMLLGVIFLGGLTLFVLIIESNWTSGNGRSLQRVSEKNISADLCWLKENFKIIEDCRPCSDFEIASKSNKICSGTHFKEAVHCEKSGKVFRSCERVAWLEERRFWQFEGFMFMLGCFSTVTVYMRQRILDYRTLKRIHRQIANSMAQLFVAVYCVTDDTVEVPVPSAVCLFLLRYLQSPDSVRLTLVVTEQSEPALKVSVRELPHRSVTIDSLPSPVSDCFLPVFANKDSTSCVAGLCAVLRQVVKYSGPEWRYLLGFREGCLFACAEVSLWTKFCEIDIIEVVNSTLFNKITIGQEVQVPDHLARFEEHLKQPVRMHNVDKLRKQTNQELVNHDFAEGHSMSLADLIIVPCVRVFMQALASELLSESLPSVLRWYELVTDQERVEEALEIIQAVESQVAGGSIDYILPSVPCHSLYKGDPKRYKPKSKLYTKQDEVEAVLRDVEELCLELDYDEEPFGAEVPLDWASMADDAQPDVPQNRLVRKRQQLENLTKAVIKVAQPGDTIVDFCCGSGHLGVVLALSLPQCRVVLLDNKEESLARAKSRVMALALRNAVTVQSNLDYFKGQFQIGVSLHACGVASDLVMHSCLQRNAAFVICPCCYGSVQNTHVVTYPRSEQLAGLTLRDYLVLSHCADQTHTEIYDKSAQGERCMAIVDYDRCQLARCRGYSVSLAKLVPPSASPKNNLLVGIPHSRTVS